MPKLSHSLAALHLSQTVWKALLLGVCTYSHIAKIIVFTAEGIIEPGWCAWGSDAKLLVVSFADSSTVSAHICTISGSLSTMDGVDNVLVHVPTYTVAKVSKCPSFIPKLGCEKLRTRP